MSNSNIAGYDISIDPFAPNLLHEQTPEGAVGITASASIDDTSGNPNVVTTRTKVGDNYNFDFAFTGLVGEKGEKGDKGDRGATGQRGLQGMQGLTGPKGDTGETGATGIGISNIAFLDYDNNGNAVYRITLTNASTYDFIAYKGPQGEQGPQGLPGDGADGVGISNIAFSYEDANGNNVYIVTLSNGQTYNFTANRGPQGLPGANGSNGTNGQDGQTPVVSATATVDNTSGTPAVSVSTSGTTLAPVINFEFTGLKGEEGGSAGELVYEGDVTFNYTADSATASSACNPTEQITNKRLAILKSLSIPAASLSDLSSGDSIKVVLTNTSISNSNPIASRNCYLGKAGGSTTGSNVSCFDWYELIVANTTDIHRKPGKDLPVMNESASVPVPPVNYVYLYAPAYVEQSAKYNGSNLSIDLCLGFDLENIVYDSSITYYTEDTFAAVNVTYKIEVYKI